MKVVEQSLIIIDKTTIVAGKRGAAFARGRIASETTKNVNCDNKVYTVLCLILEACEVIALICSTVRTILFRENIYSGAKIVSIKYMAFRNACAGEGC